MTKMRRTPQEQRELRIVTISRRRWLLTASVFVFLVVSSGIATLVLHPRARFYAGLATNYVTSRLSLKNIDLNPSRERLRSQFGADLLLPLSDGHIYVSKSKRTLDLYDGDQLFKSYMIGLGRHPEGHKQRKGDSRTPEGLYYICTRRLNTKDHLFLGLNYPRAADAAQAVEQELISVDERRVIEQAEENKQIPPWDTQLGGAIGIHGGGARDWTAGCIALNNRDVEEVYVATAYWTPVEIRE